MSKSVHPGSETKLVVKPGFSGELAQLPVPGLSGEAEANKGVGEQPDQEVLREAWFSAFRFSESIAPNTGDCG